MALRAIEEQDDGQLGGADLPARLLRIGLAALSSRALVWVASVGGGAVWTFAVLHPEGLRLVAATGYCVTVLFPILMHDWKQP